MNTLLRIALLLLCGGCSGVWAGEQALADTVADTTAAANTSPALTLDQLLQSIKQQRARERSLNQQREQRFLQAKQAQEQLLNQARSAHTQASRDSAPLQAQTDANQQTLTRLQTQLQQQTRDLGDLQAAFHEFAGAAAASLQQSMVSPELPERSAELNALANQTTLPEIADLESLWLLMQEEMTRASQLQRYSAAVIDSQGKIQPRPILRAGTFTSSSDSDFIRYLPETGELLSLNRAPPQRYRAALERFEAAAAGALTPVVIDPTQGSLLGILGYSPDMMERIDQAGTIGLVIIALGVIGVLVTLWRVGYLGWVAMRVKNQLQDLARPTADNPLGRVLLQAGALARSNVENIQFKLDEAVLAELPRLEQGQNFIKLLAAVAPLLGLLGTVTGMILTFQSISLFGNGDPKLMAGGISQALMTTVLGLVVAIPLLFGHNLVAALSRNLVQRLDEQSAGLLARSSEQQEPA